jgi:hypothetical protein
MNNDIISIARSYFLSFDEVEKKNILTKLDHKTVEVLNEIEHTILSKNEKELFNLSDRLNLFHAFDALKDLQIEYFIGLSEILRSGESNKEIEILLNNSNPLFQKVCSMFPNEEEFESELEWGIRLAKRDQFRLQYEKIVSSEFHNISRLAAANRKIFKWSYAVAAAVIFAIVGVGVYYLINSNSVDTSMTGVKIKNQKLELATIPNLIQIRQVAKAVWKDEGASGFGRITDSVNLKMNGLSVQIENLRGMLEKISKDSMSVRVELKKNVITQLDSLHAILSTYIFNGTEKNLTLNLSDLSNEVSVVSVKNQSLEKLYIRLKNKYFLITENSKPQKLIPITDIEVINELKKIEFLNN